MQQDDANAGRPDGVAQAAEAQRPGDGPLPGSQRPGGSARLDDATQEKLEAAAFRALMHHLLEVRPDVQNIDLMNLAGFCRNCLSRWYNEAATAEGIAMTKDEAREIIYGMPYASWVATHQSEADPAKKAAFAVAFAENVGGEPPKA